MYRMTVFFCTMVLSMTLAYTVQNSSKGQNIRKTTGYSLHTRRKRMVSEKGDELSGPVKSFPIHSESNRIKIHVRPKRRWSAKIQDKWPRDASSRSGTDTQIPTERDTSGTYGEIHNLKTGLFYCTII